MPRDMTRVRVGKTNAAILGGEADLSLWSEEELKRGTRMDKNGRWGGRPPVVVPKAIHDELVSRKMMAAHELLRDNLCEAIIVLVSIAKDKRADGAVRVKAANTIIERVLGKVPERVHLARDDEPAFIEAIRNSVVSIIPTDSTDTTEEEEAPQPHGLRTAGGTRNRRQREA